MNGARARHGASTPYLACGEFGYAIIVVLAVSEHPTIGRTRQPMFLKPLAVIGDVACNPTLQVVGAIGGENFSRGEIVSSVLLHSMYLSFFGTIIIPYHWLNVNPF